MCRLILRPVAGVLALLMLVPVVGMAQSATPSEELALQAYRAGEIDRAVDLYTKALSETDDANHRARLQVQIAWNLFFLGRTEEVRTHLRAALVEDPNLALDDAYYNQEFLDLFERARRSNFESAAGGGAPPPDLEATVSSINDRISERADLEGALVDVDRHNCMTVACQTLGDRRAKSSACTRHKGSQRDSRFISSPKGVSAIP